jgi:hypothetical protein
MDSLSPCWISVPSAFNHHLPSGCDSRRNSKADVYIEIIKLIDILFPTCNIWICKIIA